MWYNRFFNCIDLNYGENMTGYELAKWKNDFTRQNVFMRLCTKADARYDIINLEPAMSKRVIKQSLLCKASIGFFEKEGNILALPANPMEGPTLNGDFRRMNIYGRNGYNETINIFVPGGNETNFVKQTTSNYFTYAKPTGVWMRENRYCYPFINFCIERTEQIADAMRVLDGLRFHLKSPYIIVADEQN